jgi:hypothetical protein
LHSTSLQATSLSACQTGQGRLTHAALRKQGARHELRLAAREAIG